MQRTKSIALTQISDNETIRWQRVIASNLARKLFKVKSTTDLQAMTLWLTPSDTRMNNLTLHRYKRTNKSYTEVLGDGVELTLMLIPAGEFLMGAPKDEPESSDNEQPQHLVRVSQFLSYLFQKMA